LHYDAAVDGTRDSLLVRGETYVTFSVFLELDLSMEFSGTRMSAFHAIRCADYTNRHANRPFVGKTTFRRMCWQWIQRATAPLDHLFSCPACDALPDGQRQVIFDGIHLGIQRKRLELTPLPDCAGQPHRPTNRP
jgi:hypothetical protein